MIAKDSYWVVADELLGVRKPASLAEVAELKAMDIGGIISLLDDKENHELYTESPIDFLWTPVKGGTTPTPKQVAEAAGFVQKIKESGKAVAVHCSGGRKRTGTLIVAMLVKAGASPEEGLQALARANPEIALSEAQLAFLRGL